MPMPTVTPEPESDQDQTGGEAGENEGAYNTIVAQAIADLAARLGVPESEIAVVSHEAVMWPDGSLGCPQPGMAYTQALVEGTQTILEYEEVRYDYHSGGGRDPFLCEGGGLTVPEPPAKGTDELLPPPGYNEDR